MNRLDEFTYWLEELPISWTIGGTWLFPFIESLHVVGAVFVLGSIVLVDLRLLGWFTLPQKFDNLLRESVFWTWSAFVLALLTGLGMFITRAGGYLNNPAFLWKMALLIVAGLNMGYFHHRLRSDTNKDLSAPAFKMCGGISLSLWLGVMLAGRWIGHIF